MRREISIKKQMIKNQKKEDKLAGKETSATAEIDEDRRFVIRLLVI